MPNLPVRGLGSSGIVSDIHPFDLPPNVFSAGVNVRFENGTVSRGPVCRDVVNLTEDYDEDFSPAYVFSIPPLASGAESLIAVTRDYSSIVQFIGSTPTDVTPSTVIPDGDTGEPFTHDFLGGVTYLNRRSNVPFKFDSSSILFEPLVNWDASWRCTSLKAHKDFLIALNVKKGAIEYPTMIKWSDITPYGDEPPSWDHTVPTNSAGENILNEMRGPLVDGQALRDTFMLYGENEVWAMTYVGGQFIFDFRKRFDDIGVIAANCVVEVDGQHFVFDRDDIIVHDGSSKRSIVHGKNKDFIFRSLVRDLRDKCFVTHNPNLNEIHFCYPSQDRLVGFPNPTKGCNRAAVYNYRRDTWSFYDLPNVTAATYAAVATGLTYDSSIPYNYDEMGGTYAGDGTQKDLHQLLSSDISVDQGITASRIVGFDLIDGSRLAKPVVHELVKDAFVERIGIDLDEMGVQISAYKSLLKVYPQLAVTGGDSGVTLQFGANDVSGRSPLWTAETPFDPLDDYQIDVRTAGRYLSHRLTHRGITDFSYSGFDARITVRGKR